MERIFIEYILYSELLTFKENLESLVVYVSVVILPDLIRVLFQVGSSTVISIYPPTVDKPNHFGLLRMTNGPFLGEVVSFEPSDLYIHGLYAGACKDMSKFLYPGTEVCFNFISTSEQKLQFIFNRWVDLNR